MCWRSSTRLPTPTPAPILMKLWLMLAGFPSVVPRPIVPDWVLLQYTKADPDDWARAAGTATTPATSIATRNGNSRRGAVVTGYRRGPPSPPSPRAFRRDRIEAAQRRFDHVERGVDVGRRGAQVGQRIVVRG